MNTSWLIVSIVMKNGLSRFVLLALLVSVPALLRAQEPHAFFGVGTPGPNCPDATFSRIQDAIDQAPPGALITVCSGVYREALLITKPLLVFGYPDAVLLPRNLAPNTSSVATGSPFAALVLVKGTTGVTVQGFVVDGSAAGITQCSPHLIGVLFQNASGRILQMKIHNIGRSPSLDSCQSGVGILVQSGGGQSSKVEILDNRVYGYQKNGITANEANTSVIISRNTVVGSGPVPGVAQNGVQIGYGAGGRITKNTITENIWSPCVPGDQCHYIATGILIEQADRIMVSDNDASHNQVNVFDDGDECEIFRNHVAGAILDGIEIWGDKCRVEGNRVMDSDSAGIFILGNATTVADNEIADTSTGIFESASSTGNLVQNNHFDNVGTTVVAPNQAARWQSSPVR